MNASSAARFVLTGLRVILLLDLETDEIAELGRYLLNNDFSPAAG